VTDEVVKTILFDGKSRALIVRRGDGLYSYRMEVMWEAHGRLEWSRLGPYLDLYDTAERAEQEAIAIRASKLN
jgi:hypothetical protein